MSTKDQILSSALHGEALLAAKLGAQGHRYVRIEERTDVAGWLVLRSPASVCLW